MKKEKIEYEIDIDSIYLFIKNVIDWYWIGPMDAGTWNVTELKIDKIDKIDPLQLFNGYKNAADIVTIHIAKRDSAE